MARNIAAAATAAAAAFGLLAGGPLGPFAAVIGGIMAVAQVISAVTGFVNKLLTIVDTAIREFLVQIGAALAQRAIRRLPQWVPVEDKVNPQTITAEQVREVEGIVKHSYCDPAGTPYFQWQHWLSWSVQVQPEPEYRNLLVPGFAFARDGGTDENGKRITNPPGQPLVDPATLELQWDMGALRVGGNGPGVYGSEMKTGAATEAGLIEREAPFFQSNKGDLERENHWLWPTAGMYVWASGRWVYDCSRVSSLTSPQPLMYAMMNPVRAMATASWEAFGFKEHTVAGATDNRNAVPAIRFMFIASRHGGHLTHPSLAEQDYEFILDLPTPPEPPSPFPIGHTNAHKRGDDELPDFPGNVVVLRPKLLRDLKKPTSTFPTDVKLVTPIIELIPSPNEPGMVRQVKLTVKADDLTGTGAGHAGFLLSLGWFDPNAERAETVRRCTVEFSAVRGRIQKERDDAVAMLRRLFKPQLDKVKAEIAKQIDSNIKIAIVPGASPISIDEMVNNNLPEPAKTVVKRIGTLLRNMAHKVVELVFDKLLDLLGDAVNAGTSEEWMMHFGVNGRWRTRFLDVDKNKRQAFSSPATVEVFLGPEDALFQSTGGVEWNPVGIVMFDARNDRLLKRGNDAVNWSQIVAARGDELRDLMFEYALGILVGPSSLSLVLGVENDPLGIRQPAALDQPGQFNPMLPKSQPLGDSPLDPAATPFAFSEGAQVVLAVEDGSKKDYVLTGNVHIAEQFPK